MILQHVSSQLVGWLEFNIPFQHKYGYIRHVLSQFTKFVLGNLKCFP